MKQVNGIRLTVAHEAAYDMVFKLSRKTGFCWASNSSIAGMLGLSSSTGSLSLSTSCARRRRQ